MNEEANGSATIGDTIAHDTIGLCHAGLSALWQGASYSHVSKILERNRGEKISFGSVLGVFHSGEGKVVAAAHGGGWLFTLWSSGEQHTASETSLL